jgi:subtilase family protein
VRKLGWVAAPLVALACLAVTAPASPAAVGDPLRNLQWGLAKVQAPQAWAVTRGAGAVVAVLDTGIDLTHPDLAANVLTTGHDFVDNDNTPQDQHGHGTHVAGIAAAVADNGIGGSGVAPAAKILPVRVLDANGEGDADRIAAGIRYATAHHANVISLSLGEDTALGTAGTVLGMNDDLHAAIAEAWKAGAVIVVAAGNQSAPLCAEPAAATNVICVGATDKNDTPSYFSNSGTNSSNYVTAPWGSAVVLRGRHRVDLPSEQDRVGVLTGGRLRLHGGHVDGDTVRVGRGRAPRIQGPAQRGDRRVHQAHGRSPHGGVAGPHQRQPRRPLLLINENLFSSSR